MVGGELVAEGVASGVGTPIMLLEARGAAGGESAAAWCHWRVKVKFADAGEAKGDGVPVHASFWPTYLESKRAGSLLRLAAGASGVGGAAAWSSQKHGLYAIPAASATALEMLGEDRDGRGSCRVVRWCRAC